tara:strand:+ start:105 stop:722 length:618 start_codon:yes stop_codon:yes gene_type:complete
MAYLGTQPNDVKKNTGLYTPSEILQLTKDGSWGGSLELIEEQTVSAVSTVDFTSIKENKFDVHYMQVSNLQISDSGSNQVKIRFYESGVLETASVYQYAYQRGDSNAAFGEEKSTSAGNLLQFRNFGASDSNASASGYSYFYNLGNSAKYSFQTMHSSYLDNSSNAEFSFGGGLLPQTSTVDGIQIISQAGTISANIKLYGVKQL